ncbi:Translation machinery-associated protein 46 [Komagataella phaffii CBS 7435]|uniref:Translation machinery-associated protein 46 n=1 Tax=Komagataella phaffii (strain ATCC 76273 / CBS 7435 / CECT 11047 / NRRL Y-11430 / Wegner 21-1) TaxID=981350 RepID=F2QZW8_KOMPC|nr:GQ67_04536T0 [Komagataella phaffii]AOA69861.1 GQ68_04508T0 [Komagataella phaffii GS115]CAH2451185.1 Translation machinery-associated protein 46 [Komagataella phaffii CBS 7435]CCA40946.1 Translation machinery-associated protein 46 [Komagataella phaffii CBS 7435]
MPPKKNQPDLSKKNKQKKSQKSLEDKTFGLKNKNKSKKVQEYISQVKSTSVSSASKEAAAAKRRAEEKKAAEQAKLEAAKLFNPVAIEQKVPFGVDPKSILCVNFKQGVCKKGPKCKFSHDLEIGRKVVKKDLYTDARAPDSKTDDTMEDWDEEKLRSVISSKQGNPQTTTDKVCKFFIEAVENSKYGWFWECPNGKDCKYKHSLPPGFTLKTKEQKRLERLAADQQPKITLEELIEKERDKLPKKDLTPITWETFVKWKAEHVKRKQELQAKKDIKDKKPKTGKEIILEKFSDKFFQAEEISADKGVAFDLSQFRISDNNIADEGVAFRDYGDGSAAFAESQRLPPKQVST